MKSLALLNWGYVPVALLGVRTDFLGVLIALMMIDMVTGVGAAYVNKGGSSIKSSIFARGLLGKLTLILIPFILALAAKGAGDYDVTPLITASYAVLSLSEAYSSIGNIYSIRTGQDYPEFDAVSAILGKIKQFLDKIVG